MSDDIARTTEFLTGLFERMSLAVTFELKEDGKYLRVVVSGDDATQLVKGHGATTQGQVLEAVQLVASRFAGHFESGRAIAIELEGAGDRRELLDPVAERLATYAAVASKPVRVFAMSSSDRRAVHTALADRDDVKTDSEGHGYSRHLVITAKT
jgi:spoIIIJ-associated protein